MAPSFELDIPLIVESLEAMPIEAPGQKERKYAYSITFKAVLRERETGFLMATVNEHKVMAHIKRIEGA